MPVPLRHTEVMALISYCIFVSKRSFFGVKCQHSLNKIKNSNELRGVNGMNLAFGILTDSTDNFQFHSMSFPQRQDLGIDSLHMTSIKIM